MTRKQLFEFPNPVNEVSARLVASGVVVMSLLVLVADQMWVLIPLAYGFVARVLTGPTLSPLGTFVTRVVTPRLNIEARNTPGPPKRFAQAMGATFSISALVAYYAVGSSLAAKLIIGALVIAATLEAALGLCLGCKIFALLIRAGWVPEEVCESCADITRPRLAA